MFLMNIHIDILITQHLHNLHEYSEVAAESVFFESHLRIHQRCFESVEAEFAFQEKKSKGHTRVSQNKRAEEEVLNPVCAANNRNRSRSSESS